MEAQAKQRRPLTKHQQRGVVRTSTPGYLQQNQMPNEVRPTPATPLVPPLIGPCPGYILVSLLRLAPARGISSCSSSDWSPPR
eukprot:8361938-Pyramimonas_sp.AAC.1